MDTNLLRQQQRQQQMNSSLMRYRSAPSSLIATLMEGEVEGCDDFIPTFTNHHRSSSPEAETMFARFMTSCADSVSPDLREMEEKFPQPNGRSSKYLNSIEHHGGVEQSKYSSPTRGGSQQMIYTTPPQQQQQPPQMLNHNSVVGENAYRVANPMAQQQVKMSGPPSASVGATATSSSNLIRHSSSPAGLFSHLTVENGFAVMRGVGNSRGGNGTNGEVAASNSRLKGQINFNSGTPSSSGIMSQISEIGSESMGASSVDGGSLGNGNNSNHYMPTFPISSWDDSPLENFSGIKRARDSSSKMMSGLNSSEAQNGEGGNRPGLSHHYSLPKNSAEMAAILQFQDSVPCKIRAKRGCATHPRSIAERVRRTRISERMRKLQELVPNMDKQTNTADMLDLAVEHIKDLQKQVKTLNDGCAKCTCSSKQKPYKNPRA